MGWQQICFFLPPPPGSGGSGGIISGLVMQSAFAYAIWDEAVSYDSIGRGF